MLAVHRILLFSELVDQSIFVKVYHVVCDQVALLAVNLHDSILVDQTERYIALLGSFLLGADGTVSGVSADSVKMITGLEVDLSLCDALCNQTILGYAGLLAVDNCLCNGKRCLKVAQVIRTIQCPERSRAHAVIAELVCDLIIVCGDCDKDARSDAVDIFDYAVLIEDTAVFLQLEDFVQLLNAFCSGLCLRAVSADDIRYKV